MRAPDFDEFDMILPATCADEQCGWEGDVDGLMVQFNYQFGRDYEFQWTCPRCDGFHRDEKEPDDGCYD